MENIKTCLAIVLRSLECTYPAVERIKLHAFNSINRRFPVREYEDGRCPNGMLAIVWILVNFVKRHCKPRVIGARREQAFQFIRQISEREAVFPVMVFDTT